MNIIDVAVLVGSLRKGSYSLMVAKTLQRLSPPSLKLNIIDISQLPLYNEDLDNNTPPDSYTAFRTKINAAQAAIFITPEYNRSVPAAIKNAIDVGSRPYGKSVWSKKPAAVISVSIGAIGGFGANHHLRQSLVFLDMPCMQQPEAYLGNISQVFNEKGEPNDTFKPFMNQIITTYEAWVKNFI